MVQIQEEADFMSHNINAFEKGMNPTILPRATGKKYR